MATDLEHVALYWTLRNHLLLRFFSFGRYFRCNYLSTWNVLGNVRRPDSALPATSDGDDPSVPGKDLDATTEVLSRPTTYGPVGSTGTLPPLTSLSAAAQTTERWRIAQHRRDNPLMLTGQLMTCLAIEYHLGLKAQALPIIREALISIGELYKFPNSQDSRDVFKGYILRWDAVTSDFWSATLVNGAAAPTICRNFAIGPGPQYLYVLPRNHPAYEPRNPHVDDNSAQAGVHDNWYRRYRWPEPSFDELVGLVAAYDIVYRLVDDAWIREVVRQQIERLGTYLSGCGYLLVRPVDGFTGQGAAQSGPMFEFPFGLVFQRITGSSFTSQASFVDACALARMDKELDPAQAPYAALGDNLSWIFPALVGAAPLAAGAAVAAAVALLSMLSPAIGGLVLLGTSTLAGAVGSLLATVPRVMTEIALGSPDGRDALFVLEEALASGKLPGVAARAVGLLANQGLFDVRNNDQGGGFALAYALKELFPDPQRRFVVGMRTMCMNMIQTPFTLGFFSYVGLTALNAQPGSPESIVADEYLNFVRRRGNVTNPHELSFSQRGFARGVELVLGDASQANPIRAYLKTRFDAFTGGMQPSAAAPTIADVAFGGTSPTIPGVSSEIVLGAASSGLQNEALEYMVTLALSWLAAEQAIDGGATVPDVPVFDGGTLSLENPTVPTTLPAGLVPAFGGASGPGVVDLFPLRQTGPTSRPSDPPPQLPPVVSTETHVVTVSESNRDVDTGIGVLDLDQVSFSATGTIHSGAAFSGPSGPDGWTKTTSDSNYPLHKGPDAYRYALLVRFLDPMPMPGTPEATPSLFLGTGSRPEWSPYTHSGDDKRIWLRINDDEPGNGSGEFTVTIAVKRVSH
jgi:hypothetical protein